MKYEKPAIELVQAALGVIQSSQKKALPMIDGGELVRTTPTYEADE